jgi:hypothetical protein
MQKKFIQRTLGASAMVLLCASAASAGHDAKMFNGTFCQLALNPGESATSYNDRRSLLEYTPQGSIRNLSSADMNVICPIVQTSSDRQVAVTAFVRTTRQAGSKGGCRLISQEWDNPSNQLATGWKTFDFGNGYDYTVVSSDENTNTDKVNDPAARMWIECILPRFDANGDLYLTQYTVDEWAP